MEGDKVEELQVEYITDSDGAIPIGDDDGALSIGDTSEDDDDETKEETLEQFKTRISSKTDDQLELLRQQFRDQIDSNRKEKEFQMTNNNKMEDRELDKFMKADKYSRERINAITVEQQKRVEVEEYLAAQKAKQENDRQEAEAKRKEEEAKRKEDAAFTASLQEKIAVRKRKEEEAKRKEAAEAKQKEEEAKRKEAAEAKQKEEEETFTKKLEKVKDDVNEKINTIVKLVEDGKWKVVKMGSIIKLKMGEEKYLPLNADDDGDLQRIQKFLRTKEIDALGLKAIDDTDYRVATMTGAEELVDKLKGKAQEEKSEPFKLTKDDKADECCRFTYKKPDGSTWYLRTYKKKDNKAYDDVLKVLDKKSKEGGLKHIIPLSRHDTWTIKDDDKPNIITIEGQDFDFQNANSREIPNVKTKNIYLQKQQKGKTLKKWIEDTYAYLFVEGSTNKLKGINENKSASTDGQLKKEMTYILEGVKAAVEEFNGLETLSDGTPRFLHRDVKLENLIVDSDNKMYLFDFDAVIDNEFGRYTSDKGRFPMKNGRALMDRFVYADDSKPYLSSTNANKVTMKKTYKDNSFLDRHQAGMMLLQLGGRFDWVGDYDWNTVDPPQDTGITTVTGKEIKTQKYGPKRIFTMPEGIPAFSPAEGEVFDKYIKKFDTLGVKYTDAFTESSVENFWYVILKDKRFGSGSELVKKDMVELRKVRADLFIEAGRNLKPGQAEKMFNMPSNLVQRIFKEFFSTSEQMEEESNKIDMTTSNGVISPMQFLSSARQPVFERVQIQSDYGDDEDLAALMEFDPSVDGINLEKMSPSSHISDAEFERMLNETTNYDALSEHIMRENKAYSDNSTDMEVEEDAKSVSSKHSSASVGSVASQMSNMSAHSVASNISAQSDVSVASNLSEKSNASTMSNLSHHSYASNHSMESEEAYPTSEHSDKSYGQYSELSYNQTSGFSNSSSHSSSESSGKEMGYTNGLSESSDHGMSESSDHESSNESMGYNSSGGSSSNNHSYNSSSDTE